jgi:hypothetical protein
MTNQRRKSEKSNLLSKNISFAQRNLKNNLMTYQSVKMVSRSLNTALEANLNLKNLPCEDRLKWVNLRLLGKGTVFKFGDNNPNYYVKHEFGFSSYMCMGTFQILRLEKNDRVLKVTGLNDVTRNELLNEIDAFIIENQYLG